MTTVPPANAASRPTDAQTAPAKVSKKTLASILGSVTAALALFVMIPAEESGRKVEATAQADGSIAVRHIAGKQYLKAYLDVVRVATACDGITKGVKLGMTFTEAQCSTMLEEQLIAHAEPVIRCIPALYGRPNQAIGVIDLSFNIGAAGVCKSTIAKLFNAGRWRDGCNFLPAYNKADGRVIAGLVARRERERVICLRGLPA